MNKWYFLSGLEYVVPPIRLPRLSSLMMVGSLTDISTLTTHIEIALKAAFHLNIILHAEDLNGDLATKISAVFHTPKIIPTETLQLLFCCLFDNSFSIKCWIISYPLAHRRR